MSNPEFSPTPPVGFHFAVCILTEGSPPFPPADAAFQEVSGISLSLETEQITEGGQNRFVHQVPGHTQYEDLVLKRGQMVSSSALAHWCTKTFHDELTEKIVPKTIQVSLLDATANGSEPIMSWIFHNAYPIKWEVVALNARQSDIVVETLSFAYSYFERQGQL